LRGKHDADSLISQIPGGWHVGLDTPPIAMYRETMKNITVSVEDDIYHRARIKAAEKKTSLSALVKRFLIEVVQEESEFDRLKRKERELRETLRASRRGLRSADNLPREALHDRDALR
jgi:hypothetical protein